MIKMKVLKFLAGFAGLVLCASEMEDGSLNFVTSAIGICMFIASSWSFFERGDEEQVEKL